METNKLIAGIVAAAIAVIVLAGVLMPALSNATTTHEDLSNSGYFNMGYTEDDITIEWTRSAPRTLTVNNVAVDVTDIVKDKQLSVMCADTFCVRYMENGSGSTITVQALGDFNGIQSGTSGLYVDLTVTCSSGTMTAIQHKADESSVTRSTTYTTGVYYIAEDGDYVMKDSSKPAYMYEDSPIFAFGVTEDPAISGGLICCLTGDIENGVTATAVKAPASTTLGTVTVNAAADQNYVDVYDLSTLTFTCTLADSTEIPITYSYYIVPAEISDAERSVHLDPAMNGILNVIPVLIIVALLLGVVAVFILRRE